MEAEQKGARMGGLWSLGAILLVGFFAQSFHAIGGMYGDFLHAYGTGANEIPYGEQSFLLWYLVLGSLSVVVLAQLFERTSWGLRLEQLGRWFGQREALWVGLGACWVVAASLAFRYGVLQGAPISDDELTYRFIAKTLLNGHVINPSPGDIAFFKNQFVLLTDKGWYGKYPIGHPLFLAAGEAVGWRGLAMPVVTGINFVLAYGVGRRVFSSAAAGLGALLLALSPQFVLTGATDLSQPSSCFAMLLGLLWMLKLRDTGQLRWVLLAGLAFGFAVLVRPFPGLLFLPVVVLYTWFGFAEQTPAVRIKYLLCGAVGVGIFGLLFLGVNTLQTGHPLHTGYHYEHAKQHFGAGRKGVKGVELLTSLGALKTKVKYIASSVFSALARQNVWLFGWPLSLLFAFFARRSPKAALLWGMVAAIYGYRVLVPKTFVSTTGPIYVMEAVPLLALLTASGMLALREGLARHGLPQSLVASVCAASLLTSMLMFLPVQFAQISRCGRAYRVPFALLERADTGGKALIFTNALIPPKLTASWAYFPPNPSPGLDDKYIFVRRLPGRRGALQNMSFWQRRFPNRSAWIFEYVGRQELLRPVRSARDFLLKFPKKP